MKNLVLKLKYSLTFIILILFFLISIYHTSLITYFYSDNIWLGYLHELSKSRNLIEILQQKYNIFKIPIIPLNPDLNILSNLNYDVNEKPYSYIRYIFVLRLIEIFLTIIIYYSISKNKNFFFPIIIYFAFIFEYNIFDHQSYINFPIIIFNFFIALSILSLNNLKIFSLLFLIGNTWSYLINPTYFFITALGPFSFLIFYLFFKKKYLNLIISILINLPFTLMYVLLVIGTERIALGNKLTGDFNKNIYNFNIFHSKFLLLFILLISFVFLLNIFSNNYKKKLSIDFLFLIFYFIFSLCVGLLFNFNLISGGIPHPIYIDYSMQFIIFAIFSNFLNNQDNKIQKLTIALIFLFFIFKIIKVKESFFNFTEIISKTYKIDSTNLEKRFIWQKNNKFFLDEKFSNSRILVNMPNKDSSFSNYVFNGNYEKNYHYSRMHNYINKIKHSFVWNEFYQSHIVVNLGHSLLLNISSALIFSPNGKSKNTIPIYSFIDPLNDIFNFDYVLSDKKLSLKKIKEFNFDEFFIYLYKYPNRKFYKIENINEIKNYNNSVKHFGQILFLEKKNITIVKKMNIKNFCKVIDDFSDPKKINFKILNTENNMEKCFGLLPIPYSRTNLFYFKNKPILTYRSQYLFHGGIFKNGDIIEVKKMNLFFYPIYSFLDFLEFNKFKHFIYANSKN